MSHMHLPPTPTPASKRAAPLMRPPRRAVGDYVVFVRMDGGWHVVKREDVLRSADSEILTRFTSTPLTLPNVKAVFRAMLRVVFNEVGVAAASMPDQTAFWKANQSAMLWVADVVREALHHHVIATWPKGV